MNELSQCWVVNPLAATRKRFFSNLRAMLLKKGDASMSAMPLTVQTMSQAALRPTVRLASAM
jgi:hypothetical protein